MSPRTFLFRSKSAACRSIRVVVFFLGIPLLAQTSRNEIELRPRATLESRLKQIERGNVKRQQVLKGFFEEAGCTGDALVEQPYAKKRPPNVVCTLPGNANSTVIVGAHFDHSTEYGTGAIDNWTGTVLLPTLVETLRSQKRHNTFFFVGFSGEERGLRGSSFYVTSLTKEQVQGTRAMINIDSLGLGPTNVWVSIGDRTLFRLFSDVAWELRVPIVGSNLEWIARSDSEPFRQRHMPTLDVHSITSENISILHSTRDNLEAISVNDYYQSYRLLANYLLRLDQKLK